jgi:molybdenum cofactor cytidylyltransferase
VAEAQITPLAIERRAVEAAARQETIVQLRPFVPHEVILFTRDAREVPGLKKKLAWFGCQVRELLDLAQCGRGLQPAVSRLKPAPTLVLVSGSNALDPLDPVFVTLERLGATMQRVGMPVHPGTLLWIASWNATTIIGLPSCGLGPQVTGFDLVLPKILAEGGIRDDELALLGHGGILSFARARTLDEEAVDEPVR